MGEPTVTNDTRTSILLPPSSSSPAATPAAPDDSALVSLRDPSLEKWAQNSIDTCRQVLTVPPNYPTALQSSAFRFTGIQSAWCRHDSRAARQAFHFLQDTEISFQDSAAIAHLKADLIIAAARVATSGGYRVFADQEISSAKSTLSLIDARK